MNKFLLIGSDGYLGSYFKKHLKKKNKIVIDYKYKDFYSNKSLEIFKNKVDFVIHFAISKSLDKKKNFYHDIKFAKKLFIFCKKNKIKCYYISSISAFKKNKSFYSQLKNKIENIAVKSNIKIIKPGMVWSNSPKSWFGNINEIVNKCFFFIPLIGNGSHHIYLVNINDFTETLFKILKKNRVNKFVIHHKDTFAFRDIIKKICIKKNKINILIPIPSFLIFLIFKFLYKIKVLSSGTYDSLQSYRYAKKHTFKGYEIITTSKSFKKY